MEINYPCQATWPTESEPSLILQLLPARDWRQCHRVGLSEEGFLSWEQKDFSALELEQVLYCELAGYLFQNDE